MGFADGLEIVCEREVLSVIRRVFCAVFLSNWKDGVLFAEMGVLRLRTLSCAFLSQVDSRHPRVAGLEGLVYESRVQRRSQDRRRVFESCQPLPGTRAL